MKTEKLFESRCTAEVENIAMCANSAIVLPSGPFCMMIGQLGWEKIGPFRADKHLVAMLDGPRVTFVLQFVRFSLSHVDTLYWIINRHIIIATRNIYMA